MSTSRRESTHVSSPTTCGAFIAIGLPAAVFRTPPVSQPTSDIWTRRFIPDRLTPLPFTPVWSQLRPHEQLRYNQLHGLYYHEQIIFFEQGLIVPLLRAAQPRIHDRELRDSIDEFIAEEHAHSAAFHRLLSELRPEWYKISRRHFITVNPLAGTVFATMVRYPQVFPFLIWLVQLLEERTMFASRLYLTQEEIFPANIVAIQRWHLADEADHVRWDAALIAQFWAGAPTWLRRLNAHLLDRMLAEFIALPRRAALRVIDALAKDIPNLSVPPTQLKTALKALARRDDFRAAVFGRDAVPRTWKQASHAPDLHGFVNSWLAHEHAP